MEYDHLSPLLFLHVPWALQLGRCREGGTSSTCSAECRPGSLAAHWKYRNIPLVDLEKVRAFITRLACTQPSLCLFCSQVLFSARRLNRPTTGVPPPASPEAAGISTPVGRVQADNFSARQKLCCRPYGSNSCPIGPSCL